MMVESLLLAVTRVSTMSADQQVLSNATGFFFEDQGKLFLITNRHVVLSEETGHQPQSLQIELHIDASNLTAVTDFQVPLYANECPLWSEQQDTAGLIDMVAIELSRAAMPETLVHAAFTRAHLVQQYDHVEMGTSLLIVGFPLGFHDSLHHLPVARQAVVASAFGFRFQGNGYFLTDARLHRGMSGAPVVTAVSPSFKKVGALPWMLLGVHAARLDVGAADLTQDERLGLNCAWYTDVLPTLTQPPIEPGLAAATPPLKAVPA